MRYRDKFFLAFTVVILLLSPAASTEWAAEDMQKCVDIDITGGEQELENFPIPLEISAREGMLDDYRDIRFYDEACAEGGEQLPHEIEDFNSEFFEAWTGINTLTVSGETISLYYDNTTSVSSEEEASNVWDNNFTSVQHFEQEVDGDEGIFSGSTENQISGETLNGVETSRNGVFDGAYGFDGQSTALNFSDNFNYSDSEAFTFSIWLNSTGDLSEQERILGFNRSSSWSLYLDNETEEAVFGFNGSELRSDSSIDPEAFNSVSVRYDGDGGLDLFVNGTMENSTAEASWEEPVEEFAVGASGRNDFLNGSILNFEGVLDEFRVSESTRQDSWIQHSTDVFEEEAFNTTGQTDFVETEITSPDQEFIDEVDVDLEVETEGTVNAWNFTVNDDDRTAGLSGIAYVNSSDELKVRYESEETLDFASDAQIIGDEASLKDDRFLQIPFVDSQGDLKAADRNGLEITLASGLATSDTVIASGMVEEQDYVFFTDESDNNYLKKVRHGESPETIEDGVSSDGALGKGDFTGDGEDNIIYLDSSDEIRYLEDGSEISTGFSDFGSNDNKGIGPAADFNGSGQVRVPYVTQTHELALLDHEGGTEIINGSYSEAAKTRVAAADWTGTGEKQLLHLDLDTGELRYMHLNGTWNTIASPDTREKQGVASANQHSINHTVRGLPEGQNEITVESFEEDTVAEDSTEFTVDNTPPDIRNLSDNVTDDLVSTEAANLSIEASDDVSGLDEVILSTNESGSFENRTDYGSPQSFGGETSIYRLADFIWDNTEFNGSLGYRMWASDLAGNVERSETQSFEVFTTDLNASGLRFNTSDPIEGQKLKITSEVQNRGTESVEANVTLQAEAFNGSEWENVSEEKQEELFESEAETELNFTFTLDTGPYRFTSVVDPDDSVDEPDRSNNNITELLDVSAYQINYGGTSSTLALGTADSDQPIKSWSNERPEGTIFYADSQASYSIQDLMPLNESNDLQEATKTLGMEGYNDSISQVWDENQDGEADFTKCVEIAGDEVCDIPFVNSTNTSDFQTGIMYDAGDGEGFDGSQDLVILTEVNEDGSQGRYGFYNYEARIPSHLSRQYEPHGFIDVRLEFD